MIIIVKMQWLPSVNTVAFKRDNNHIQTGETPSYTLYLYTNASRLSINKIR